MSNGKMGMVIPAIPASWVRCLTEIQDTIGAAYIAGGCLRDLVLGRPIKDVDIAVQVPFAGKDLAPQDIQDWVDNTLSFRMVWHECDLKDYQLNFGDLHSVWDVDPCQSTFMAYPKTAEPPPFQILFMKEPITVQNVVERCDFGICRIGHDGLAYYIHPDFLEDLSKKEFNLRRCSSVDSHWKRWMRLREKYPDFTLNSREIEDWAQKEGMDLTLGF